MVHRYDLLLGGIAASLSGGALVGVLTGIPIYYGIGLGAIPGLALILDAVYLHPPMQGEEAAPSDTGRRRAISTL